jgi:hypothetical protein
MEVDEIGGEPYHADGSREIDDPILTEIPVYLNRLHDPPDMCGEIYVLLDALRQRDRPYGDQGQLTSVEFDEDTSRLRMNYSLNSLSETYDASSSYPLRKHSIVGKPVPRDSSSGSSCVAILRDNSLNLVPVTSVCSMRPCFEHIESEAATRKTVQTNEKTESGESKPLTGRAMHYQQLVKSVRPPKPQWRKLDHYDWDSVEASDLLEKHIHFTGGGQESEERYRLFELKQRDLEFVPGSQADYLVALTSGRNKSTGETSGIGDHSELSRLDFGRQIEALMKREQVCTFTDLMAALPANTRARYSQADVLAKLNSCALLIQGNWVVLSHLSGLRPQMWDTRDALLLLIHSERDVLVTHLSKISQLGKDDIEDVLKTLCTHDLLANIWKFKMRKDEEFIRTHPDLVDKQTPIVQDIIQRLQAKQQRRAAEEASGGTPTVKQLDAEETKMMIEIVQKKLMDLGALTTDEVRHAMQANTRDHFVKEVHALDILRVIEAIPIRERWARRTRGKHDDLRQQLIDMYQTRDAFTKEEIVAAFQTVRKGKFELTDSELRKIIKEFAHNDKGFWVFNGKPIAERFVKSVKDEIDDIVMH